MKYEGGWRAAGLVRCWGGAGAWATSGNADGHATRCDETAETRHIPNLAKRRTLQLREPKRATPFAPAPGNIHNRKPLHTLAKFPTYIPAAAGAKAGDPLCASSWCKGTDMARLRLTHLSRSC